MQKEVYERETRVQEKLKAFNIDTGSVTDEGYMYVNAKFTDFENLLEALDKPTHVTFEAQREMERQVAKFGVQNWPMYRLYDVLLDSNVSANYAKELVDDRAQHGDLSYTDILLEEVMEAIEEARAGKIENLRTELIQVAAVALSMVECIDRNKK